MSLINTGKDASDAPVSTLKTRAGNKLRALLAGFGLVGAVAAYTTSDTIRDAVDGGVKNISESVTQSHVLSFSDTSLEEARKMIKNTYAPEEVDDVLASFDNRITELEITNKGTISSISGDYFRSWEHGNSFFPYGFDRNHSVKMDDGTIISAEVSQSVSENPK